MQINPSVDAICKYTIDMNVLSALNEAPSPSPSDFLLRAMSKAALGSQGQLVAATRWCSLPHFPTPPQWDHEYAKLAPFPILLLFIAQLILSQ